MRKGIDNTEKKQPLLFNILDLLPLALEVLLPQTDLVVAPTYGKDVTAETPAHTPQNSVKFECLAAPLARVGGIGGPDTNGLVLRR